MKSSYVNETVTTIELETILLRDIKTLITTYEQKIFKDLSMRRFQTCENHLTQFCFDLLDLDDFEQVFVARIFFTSLVTDLMKKQGRRDQLQPKMLSHVFKVVATIDTFQNISEYLLYIPQFLETIAKEMIGNHLIIENNPHIEKILRLIDLHISDTLTVQWLAEQIDLSTTHITNLFKQHLDQTIPEYIMLRKVNEIAYELITSTDSVTKIYKKYGFVNQSHFTQRFKQIKGLTPLQYRKTYFKQ